MADTPNNANDCKPVRAAQSVSSSGPISYDGNKVSVNTYPGNEMVDIVGPLKGSESIYKLTAYDNSVLLVDLNTPDGPHGRASTFDIRDPELAQKIRDAAKAAKECGKFGPAEEVMNGLKITKPAGQTNNLQPR